MNGLEEESMSPQTFLYGCSLEKGKEVAFNPADEDFQHQLDLRMACVDARTKDELHVVEVEGEDMEGQKITTVLVSLRPSALPSVCLGGFTITPPVVFRLKTGSGPVHLSGQHLVMGIDDDVDEESEEEDEEEAEEVNAIKPSKKRPAPSPADHSKKKLKMDEEEDDEEDDDDEDEDEEEEETPVKVKPVAKAAAQNGKSPKATTPVQKEVKTPKSSKSPKAPKEPMNFTQSQEFLLERVKKGVSLPRVQTKFDNFVKNTCPVESNQVLVDLWAWRQTLKDSK